MASADGLHSNVRRLVFGDEAGLSRFLGGYLAVVSVPKAPADDGEMVGHPGVGRTAGIYRAAHLHDARALFMFRTSTELEYHYRDAARQQQRLRAALRGMHPQVDRWPGEIDRTAAFYLDAITQRRLGNWSRPRVTLVGDAA